jgi:hypothetical protein
MCAPLTLSADEHCPLSRNSRGGQPKSTHIPPKRDGVYGHRWALVFTARTSTAWSPPLQHQDPGSHLAVCFRATLSSFTSRQHRRSGKPLPHPGRDVVDCDKSPSTFPKEWPEVRSTPATRKRYVIASLRSAISRAPRLVGPPVVYDNTCRQTLV